MIKISKKCLLKGRLLLSSQISAISINFQSQWTTTNIDYLSKLNKNSESWVKRIVITPVTNYTVDENTDLTNFKADKKYGYAMLLSYCGKGYNGMQIINGLEKETQLKSIEFEIMNAMVKSSLIEQICVSRPQFYKYQRASRTDRNVSAVRQIISFSLSAPVENISSLVNQYLPQSIRSIDTVRSSANFNAKSHCTSRSYSYMAPTYAFSSICEIANKNYRTSPENIEQIRQVLSMYVGNHNFHNFTSKVKFDDKRAVRQVKSITCSDPFVRDGIEWIQINVTANSFMLHQIRKMIGLTIAVCKGVTTKEIFEKVWTSPKCDIPIAPAEGLVLESPNFDVYNRKINKSKGSRSIKWKDTADQEIQEFREKHIDTVAVEAEVKDQRMLSWLSHLPFYAFDAPRNPEDNQVKFEDRNGFYKAQGCLLKYRRKLIEESLHEKGEVGTVCN